MKTLMKTAMVAIVMGVLFSCSGSSKSEMMYNSPVAEEAAVSVEEEAPYSQDITSSDKSMTISDNYDIQEDRMEAESITENVQESRREAIKPDVPNFIASQAASTYNSDAVHKLIRNVNMRFKVKNVPRTTYAIESIVLKNGGHIRRSAIENRNSHSSIVNISKDSAIVIQYDNLVANIQFRVHYSSLDTVLREIAPYAVHIDHRTVDVKDVTFYLLEEKLTRARMDKKQKRISSAIDNRGQKLNDIMGAEQSLDYAAEQADRALIEDYRMQDQIEYSTVSVEIYQNQTQYQERVARIKSVDEYEPSFGTKIVTALQNGWELIAFVFIVLINIWPVLLIVVIVTGIGIYFRNKKRKVKP